MTLEELWSRYWWLLVVSGFAWIPGYGVWLVSARVASVVGKGWEVVALEAAAVTGRLLRVWLLRETDDSWSTDAQRVLVQPLTRFYGAVEWFQDRLGLVGDRALLELDVTLTRLHAMSVDPITGAQGLMHFVEHHGATWDDKAATLLSVLEQGSQESRAMALFFLRRRGDRLRAGDVATLRRLAGDASHSERAEIDAILESIILAGPDYDCG